MASSPRSPTTPSLYLSIHNPETDADGSTSDDEFPSNGPRSLLSPSALELLPEGADDSPDAVLFEFSDDDDDLEHGDTPGVGVAGGLAGALARLSAGPVPPLPPLQIFLLALAPSIRLGAFLLPYQTTPLVKAIPALVLFAGLAALARQIWYMLARYVGTADVETVVAMTFARDPRKGSMRRILRSSTRAVTAVFRILLATTYLRESVDALSPYSRLFVDLDPRLVLTSLATLFIISLSWTPSIGAKRITVTSWLSLVLYMAWFTLAAVAHGKGLLTESIPPEGRGVLWDGIPIIAFTFTTLWDIPLYASLKAGSRPGPRSFQSKGYLASRSFRVISLLATALSVGLILPLLFFGPSDIPATMLRVDKPLNTAMAALSALVLIMSIPALVITTPAVPLPGPLRRSNAFPFSRTIVLALIFALSMVPDRLAMVLSDLTLLLALVGNYFLPAFLHIAIHQFKRPLSILLPRSAPLALTRDSDDSDDDEHTPLHSAHSAHFAHSAQSPHSGSFARTNSGTAGMAGIDELLVRKERALQKTRLMRRVAWDVAVWTMLLPVGGGGAVWAVGRLVGWW